MRKVLAIAAFSAISLGALSVASANGTVKADCPKPVHHHKAPHHKPHHVQHHEKHCAPACPPCPSLHSGFFAGLKGGYSWAKGKLKQANQYTNGAVVVDGTSAQLGADGGLVGLFLGYDRYFPNCWMLGIEGSANWTDVSGKSTSGFAVNGVLQDAWRTRLKTDWSYDIAIRLGRKVYDCSLWYVKTGAQFTHFKLNTGDFANNLTASKHKYRTGWLAGFGVEVPVACHWSLGAEYNFTYYQRIKTGARATNGTNNFTASKIRPYSNTILARVIWKQ